MVPTTQIGESTSPQYLRRFHRPHSPPMQPPFLRLHRIDNMFDKATFFALFNTSRFFHVFIRSLFVVLQEDVFLRSCGLLKDSSLHLLVRQFVIHGLSILRQGDLQCFSLVEQEGGKQIVDVTRIHQARSIQVAIHDGTTAETVNEPLRVRR